MLPQGFHLISLLRRQLSSLCRLRDISLRPEGVFPQGEAYCGLRQATFFVQPLRLALLASSPSRGAFGKEVSSQRKGELAGLSATPEPPLLGEVALRSNDGEVGQSRALSGICVGSPFGRAAERSEAERARIPTKNTCNQCWLQVFCCLSENLTWCRRCGRQRRPGRGRCSRSRSGGRPLRPGRCPHRGEHCAGPRCLPEQRSDR